MLTKDFIKTLNQNQINFFTGVPDSLLNELCFELMMHHPNHVKIGVNEGASVAMAAGHFMATAKTPCVFMQNSGLGNIVNPVTSLMHEKVYAIPALYVVGWRGEPGVKDEPQHIFMGEATLKLLDTLEIAYQIIDKNTTQTQLEDMMRSFLERFKKRLPCALVVKKGTFASEKTPVQQPQHYALVREDAIASIIERTGKNDLIVSSTGKISRELFEIRDRLNQSHGADFLTVGSMGFASSIAAQIASELPARKVYCIDGDGAALMHLGAMATIGSQRLDNFVHIILDNESHETVGGVPTVSGSIDWKKLSIALGYRDCFVIISESELKNVESFCGGNLYVVKVKKQSREDLGRPTTTAKQNIDGFMKFIKEGD